MRRQGAKKSRRYSQSFHPKLRKSKKRKPNPPPRRKHSNSILIFDQNIAVYLQKESYINSDYISIHRVDGDTGAQYSNVERLSCAEYFREIPLMTYDKESGSLLFFGIEREKRLVYKYNLRTSNLSGPLQKPAAANCGLLIDYPFHPQSDAFVKSINERLLSWKFQDMTFNMVHHPKYGIAFELRRLYRFGGTDGMGTQVHYIEDSPIEDQKENEPTDTKDIWKEAGFVLPLPAMLCHFAFGAECAVLYLFNCNNGDGHIQAIDMMLLKQYQRVGIGADIRGIFRMHCESSKGKVIFFSPVTEGSASVVARRHFEALKKDLREPNQEKVRSLAYGYCRQEVKHSDDLMTLIHSFYRMSLKH